MVFSSEYEIQQHAHIAITARQDIRIVERIKSVIAWPLALKYIGEAEGLGRRRPVNPSFYTP